MRSTSERTVWKDASLSKSAESCTQHGGWRNVASQHGRERTRQQLEGRDEGRTAEGERAEA
eukprot:1055926-Prymnesium_polylepis.2